MGAILDLYKTDSKKGGFLTAKLYQSFVTPKAGVS